MDQCRCRVCPSLPSFPSSPPPQRVRGAAAIPGTAAGWSGTPRCSPVRVFKGDQLSVCLRRCVRRCVCSLVCVFIGMCVRPCVCDRQCLCSSAWVFVGVCSSVCVRVHRYTLVCVLIVVCSSLVGVCICALFGRRCLRTSLSSKNEKQRSAQVNL